MIVELINNPLFFLFFLIEIVTLLFGFYYIFKLNRYKSANYSLIEQLKGLFSSKEDIKLEDIQTSKELFKGKIEQKIITKVLDLSEVAFKTGINIELNEISYLIENNVKQTVRRIKTIINALPILGLIGTFLGISLAVINLKFTDNLSDVYNSILANIKSLQPFVTGIRFAFLSSLVGLFFALILKIIYELAFNGISESIDNLLLTIKIEFFTILSTKDPFDKLNKSINSFGRKAGTLSSEVKKSLNAFVTQYNIESGKQQAEIDKRVNRLDTINNSINNNLINLIDDLKSNTENLILGTSSLNIQIKNSEGLLNSLQEVSKSSRLENQSQLDNIIKIGEATRRLNADSVKIFDKLKDFYDPISSLGNKIESLIEKTSELNVPLTDALGVIKLRYAELTNSLSKIQEEYSSLLIKVNDNILSLSSLYRSSSSSILESSRNGEILLSQINKVEDNLDKSIQGLSSYSNDLVKAGQLFVNDLSTSVKQLFDDLSAKENISLSLTKIEPQNDVEHREFSEKLTTTLSKFDNTLNGINKNLENLDHTLKRIQKPWFIRIFKNGRRQNKVVG